MSTYESAIRVQVTLGPFELELQVVYDLSDVVLGTKLESPGRAASFLNC